ncbi:phosphate acyltransferase, partial [Acinetobacter baumannii]
PKRVLFAEGEEENVLRAVQVALDENLARPVLLGRADIIARRIQNLGLRLKVGENCEVVNILSDSRYSAITQEYYEI